MQHGELPSNKAPLHKFPVCESSKVDDWSEATLPVFGPTVVELRRSSKPFFRARLNLCPLQRLSLCYGSFEGAFSVKVPDSCTFAQGLPIRGTAQHVTNGMVILDSPHKGA